jgi:hypothetical protein
VCVLHSFNFTLHYHSELEDFGGKWRKVKERRKGEKKMTRKREKEVHYEQYLCSMVAMEKVRGRAEYRARWVICLDPPGYLQGR